MSRLQATCDIWASQCRGNTSPEVAQPQDDGMALKRQLPVTECITQAQCLRSQNPSSLSLPISISSHHCPIPSPPCEFSLQHHLLRLQRFLLPSSFVPQAACRLSDKAPMCGLCWRIALRDGSMGQERQSHFGRTQGRCQLSGIGDASVKRDLSGFL